MVEVEFTSKACSKCRIVRPIGDFYKRPDRPGKRRPECRFCASANSGGSYYRRNKKAILAAAAERYSSDPRIKERAYAYKRSDRGKAVRRIREAKPAERLAKRIRGQILYALRSGKARSPSQSMVGWSIDELIEHLERQFTKGMSWDNMGEWHIDHITPLSSFDFEGEVDEIQIRRAWCLTNLRPLWAKDNLSKGSKRTHLL